MRAPIYLDYNATTPVAPHVKAEMHKCMDLWLGNPTSTHWAGELASCIVTQAREKVANLIGCRSSEVVFTSGGTEANNYALKGVFYGHRRLARPHFIISAIEHPAIVNPCRFLETLGARVTQIPVDSSGVIDPTDVERAIVPETLLISVMLANNEVGTLQPVRDIASTAKSRGVLVHTDAAQALGKIPVNVQSLGVDLLSIAGHKLYAPQGVGALYIRDGVTTEPFFHGAGHESGRRAGTENLLEICALGAACEESIAWVEQEETCSLRNYFLARLEATFGERVSLNGHATERLPNTLNVSFLGHNGQTLLSQLPWLAASTGSACHSGQEKLSPVLSAMGRSAEECRGAIRFSLGRYNTQSEIEEVVIGLSELLRI